MDNKPPINEDDIPLAQRLLALQKKRASQSSTSSSSNVKAPVKKETPAKKIKADPIAATSSDEPKKARQVKKEPKNQSDKKPAMKKDPGVPAKEAKATPSSQTKKEEENEEENDEEYKWWESQKNDTSIKWTSLEHNGLYFPPPYQAHGVHMIYDGKRIDLEPEVEEVATFFAGVVGTDHAENTIFVNNFFEDFCSVLQQFKSRWAGVIREFQKCDFTPMVEHLARLKEQKKAMTKEDKEKIKAEKQRIDEFYGICLLDGRKEKVGNFRVEPPGLFRGRGKHPKAGKLKMRLSPSQITINISQEAKVPSPPEGHQWGRVINDNTVTWLATWTENVNKQQKYVFLAAGSSLKGQSDLKKFEVARELKNHIGRIRGENEAELRSKEMEVRQRATALWLIDRLALRAGNEKGDDEADTVGCCSLRCEHVRLQEPNIVIFDFLGKDSIRYYNEVPVDPIIFKNLSIFMRPPKEASDPIFDRLTTSSLNKYLSSLMPGLTAKVFRTYNASHTFQEELGKTPLEGTVPEQILSYNRANRQVAILCNHQRAVPKTHQQSMSRLDEKITTMKFQRYKLRGQMKEIISKKDLKEECPSALESEPDLDKATIASEEQKEAALAAESSSPKRAAKPTKEGLIKKFTTLTQRIEAALNQRTDKDENKTTSLGTSKTNYIDPRLTVAWCQAHSVPVEKLFNRSLREKFKWAMNVPAEWRF